MSRGSDISGGSTGARIHSGCAAIGVRIDGARGFISVRAVVAWEQRRVENGVPEQDELDREGVRMTTVRVTAAGDPGVAGQLTEGFGVSRRARAAVRADAGRPGPEMLFQLRSRCHPGRTEESRMSCRRMA